MGRQVLNLPITSGSSSLIKKVSTFSMGRTDVSGSSGYDVQSVSVTKVAANTRMLVKAIWSGHTANSYAVGLRVYFSGQQSELYTGSNYSWQHSGGTDAGQSMHSFIAQKIVTPQDYNGTSSWAAGTYTLNLGYSVRSGGGGNRPGSCWNPSRSDDSRGNGPNRGTIIVMELI